MNQPAIPQMEKLEQPSPKRKCHRCDVVIDDWNLFRQHQQFHIKEDRKCSVCGKQCKGKNGFERHVALHSSEKSFLCTVCGKAFHHFSYLNRHMACHDKNRPKVFCEICGKSFSCKANLRKHKLSQHSEKKLKCSYCDKEYRSIDYLNVHEKQHSEHFPHHCMKCGSTFKTLERLNIHERIHIGEDSVFPCSVCHKTFSSRSERNTHKRDHFAYTHPSQLYTCSLCQTQVKGIKAMARHMLKHPDLSLCLLCQKQFDSTSDLQSHITTTYLAKNRCNMKRVKCKICGEEFSGYYKLILHRASHENPDIFKCKDCGKYFNYKMTLEAHRNAKHLKTRKYECQYCGKIFYWDSIFRRHLKIHQGLKPFVCSVCGRGFGQKTSLETHSWTHRTDKRYNCETCDRGFNDKRALLSHKKSQHQEQDNSGSNDLTVVDQFEYYPNVLPDHQ